MKRWNGSRRKRGREVGKRKESRWRGSDYLNPLPTIHIHISLNDIFGTELKWKKNTTGNTKLLNKYIHCQIMKIAT